MQSGQVVSSVSVSEHVNILYMRIQVHCFTNHMLRLCSAFGLSCLIGWVTSTNENMDCQCPALSPLAGVVRMRFLNEAASELQERFSSVCYRWGLMPVYSMLCYRWGLMPACLLVTSLCFFPIKVVTASGKGDYCWNCLKSCLNTSNVFEMILWNFPTKLNVSWWFKGISWEGNEAVLQIWFC